MGQETFDIFAETPGQKRGRLEQSTVELIQDLQERCGGELEPFTKNLCVQLLTISKAADLQIRIGRVSTTGNLMKTFLDTFESLQERFPTETKADDDVEAVWGGTGTDQAD